MLPKLYELSAAYRELAEKLADADLDAQTIADTIEASGLVDDIATKLQGIEMVARSAEMHEAAIDAEIKRLGALKKHRAAVAKGLRDYALVNMQGLGITKIECPLFTVSLRNNPPSVDVYEPGLIPSDWMRQPEPPPPEPDKKRMLEALKAGQEIPGVKLKQTQRIAIA